MLNPWLKICGIALLMFLNSCSMQLSNNRSSTERREQANDKLTGTTNLLRSGFRATAMAAVRQPVTTTMLGVATLWHRPREIIRGNLPLDVGAQTIPEAPGTAAFEEMLDRKRFPKAELGRLKWLVDGREFFPAIDREIAEARQSIRVQVYIFDNDDIAVRYADRLKRRAEQISVDVLYDDLGSTFSHTLAPKTEAPRGFIPPVDMQKYLEEGSNLRARRSLNPWLASDHTKLLVFDDTTAFMGGMNIGREYYSEWHDLMLQVKGPVVSSLSREFDRAWNKAGPAGDFAVLQHSSKRVMTAKENTGVALRLLRTDPARAQYDILKATLLGIRGARRRVWIENPYFAHDEVAEALEAAARRGVDVRVILPASGDSVIMDNGNLATANGLIRAGAKIFRYPKMTHTKVMICDGWACVGSANLDTLSMRINRELNLSFSDPASIRSLERKVFEPDFRRSRQVQLQETNKPTARIAEAIADQL